MQAWFEHGRVYEIITLSRGVYCFKGTGLILNLIANPWQVHIYVDRNVRICYVNI